MHPVPAIPRSRASLRWGAPGASDASVIGTVSAVPGPASGGAGEARGTSTEMTQSGCFTSGSCRSISVSVQRLINGTPTTRDRRSPFSLGSARQSWTMPGCGPKFLPFTLTIPPEPGVCGSSSRACGVSGAGPSGGASARRPWTCAMTGVKSAYAPGSSASRRARTSLRAVRARGRVARWVSARSRASATGRSTDSFGTWAQPPRTRTAPPASAAARRRPRATAASRARPLMRPSRPRPPGWARPPAAGRRRS